MNKEKSIINTLKVMLGMETNLVETTLKNGTPVKYDKLEAGGIFQVKEGESFLTAKDGEYELEDGNIIIVLEGVISEIKEPVMQVKIVNPEETSETSETTEETSETTEETPETEEESDELKTKIEDLESRLKILEKNLNTLIGENTELKSQFSVQEEKIKEIANAPASIPVHLAKTEVEFKAMSVAEQRMEKIKNLNK